MVQAVLGGITARRMRIRWLSTCNRTHGRLAPLLWLGAHRPPSSSRTTQRQCHRYRSLLRSTVSGGSQTPRCLIRRSQAAQVSLAGLRETGVRRPRCGPQFSQTRGRSRGTRRAALRYGLCKVITATDPQLYNRNRGRWNNGGRGKLHRRRRDGLREC